MFNIFVKSKNFILKVQGKNEPFQKFEIKFKKDGTFKIVQFTDLHEFVEKNENTIKLISAVLDEEKPDLVLFTGDNIEGYFCKTKENSKKAIDNIAKPLEERKIPWAAALGNHDSEFNEAGRRDQMKLYMSYKYSLSQCNSMASGRAGDYNILISDSSGQVPVFNIFMMDSGDYCSKGYGYLKKSQIFWYKLISNHLEEKFHKIIPSLMFFHIPLNQYKIICGNGNYTGTRNEEESVQSADRGMFDEIVKMQNVKGVFCGHDHTNNYYGTLENVILGYGVLSGFNVNTGNEIKRGARVYIINEREPEKFQIKNIFVNLP